MRYVYQKKRPNVYLYSRQNIYYFPSIKYFFVNELHMYLMLKVIFNI